MCWRNYWIIIIAFMSLGLGPAAVASREFDFGKISAITQELPRRSIWQRTLLSVAGNSEVTAKTIKTFKAFINADDPIGFKNFFSERRKLILAKQTPSKPIADFLIELWEVRRERHPKLNWKVASGDRFRIIIATTLLMAVRDWDIRYDTKNLRAFVRSQVTTEDEFVAFFALTGLRFETEESDVQLLKELLSRSNFIWTGYAIEALGFLCRPDAERLLIELAKVELNVQLKRIIEETRNRYYLSKGPVFYCPPTN